MPADRRRRRTRRRWLVLLPAIATGLAATSIASPTFAQATRAATRPVSDGQSAVLIVRELVDRAGAPGAAAAVRQVEELGQPNDAPQPMRNAAAWVKANREAVEGVTKGQLPATPWGAATYRAAGAPLPQSRPAGAAGIGVPHAGAEAIPGEAPPPLAATSASRGSAPATAPTAPVARLYLHVFEWHASGKVIAYGLPTESVASAYLLRDPSKKLKVEATARDAVVEVAAKGAKAPDPIGTVVVLELNGEPKPRSLAVPPQSDGSVALHARTAVVVGRNLRYEPEPNKNTLGYWTDPADWAYWEFSVAKAGTYDVELLQGCGKGSGGSDVEVSVDGKSSLAMTVQDTGGFQNFVPRTIGKTTLSAGPHRVEVKVRQKKGAAVMDLRQVTLKPAG